MPIPVPNEKPSGRSGGRGLPKPPPRQVPKISKPNRVSNPYDEGSEDVFTTDNNQYSGSYEDASVPRKVNNPFSNHDNRDNRDNHDNHDNYTDKYSGFDDVEDEYNDYEDYEDVELTEDEKEEQMRKFAHDYYDVDQDEVESNVKKRNSRKKKRRSKNKKDNTGQDVFVNEKDLKLEPYGKKRKLKVSDFDDRANKQKKANYIRVTIVAGVVILIGLGLKNAIVPPNTLSPEEVSQISMETIGLTNFPDERGKSFVEDFTTAYLTLDKTSKSRDALSYFYTGVLDSKIGLRNESSNISIPVYSGSNFTINGYYAQEIILQPRVINSFLISDNSATYTVETLVQPKTVINTEEDEAPPILNGVEAKLVTLDINVYYDDETDEMYISPDSPIIVPNKNVGATADIPKAAPIGSGIEAEDFVIPEIKPVINGFITGFAESSTDDYSKIEQYFAPTHDETVKNGLGGTFALSGSAENAIKFTPYTIVNQPEKLRVLVEVDWQDSITKEKSTESVASVIYTSQYVATLAKDSNGKWGVERFDSVKYLPDPKVSGQ